MLPRICNELFRLFYWHSCLRCNEPCGPAQRQLYFIVRCVRFMSKMNDDDDDDDHDDDDVFIVLVSVPSKGVDPLPG